MAIKPNIPVKSPGNQFFANELNLIVDALGDADVELAAINSAIASINSELAAIDVELQKIAVIESDITSLEGRATSAESRLDQLEQDVLDLEAGAIDPADIARGIEALPEADKLDFEDGLKNKPVLELDGNDFEEVAGVTRLRRAANVSGAGNGFVSAAQVLAYVEDRVAYLEDLIGEGGGNGGVDIEAGLFLHHSFEGGTAVNWADDSGNGNSTITESSSTQFVTPGAVGSRGISLPGTNRRWGRTGARNMSVFSSGLSVSCFVNKASTGGSPRLIFSLGADGAERLSMYWWQTQGFTGIDTTSNTHELGLLSNFDTHHVVVTFAPNGELKTYVNGSLVDDRNVGTSDFNALVNDTNCEIGWGGSFDGGNGAARLDGHMDDIRLYTRVISSAEVSALYALKTADFPTSTSG